MAGNPVVSTPNASRLESAIESLEFMLAVDIYVNETTRHADVILPAPEPLQKSHYDLALYQLAVRDVANFSPAVFPYDGGRPDEWEMFLRIAGIVSGQGPDADVDALDELVARTLAQREMPGRDPEEVLAELDPRRGPERILDLLLRAGPHELTLADLEASPHGVDLGPHRPRIPVLRTASGRSSSRRSRSWPIWTGSGPRSTAERRDGADRAPPAPNNSWMHNLRPLVKGKDRCTMHVNPADAERLGLADGGQALVRSATGEVEAPVEVTDAIMPGVVSIPHGWGHDAPAFACAWPPSTPA